MQWWQGRVHDLPVAARVGLLACAVRRGNVLAFYWIGTHIIAHVINGMMHPIRGGQLGARWGAMSGGGGGAVWRYPDMQAGASRPPTTLTCAQSKQVYVLFS